MESTAAVPVARQTQSYTRWSIAALVSAAIAISYLDRQTLPWAIKAIQADIPFSNEMKAGLDSAFLITYGLMYVGGGLLLDRLGTRRGFFCIMVLWSLACASHGIAQGTLMLAASRLLLGMGEGGGFPAATRAVAEWFPVKERASAMGIINAGTAVGAVIAPPLIAVVLTYAHWFGLAPWRWVFFLTGALGLLWVIWWWQSYHTPEGSSNSSETSKEPSVSLRELLQYRETWAVVFAKFLSDGAWYFYIFWLPKYLFDAFQIDIKTASGVGWIPYAASGVGCLVGGGFSSWLLRRGMSVNASRKAALGASAALMPWVMLVPQMHSLGWVIFIFSLAFFGQQSWSTLVMVLPTDMISKKAVGTLAGLVGFGGAMGGVVLGQVVGWLRDHGYSYTPALVISGSLHIAAFILICLVIPKIQPLRVATQ
ncbi:MAG TPA: MFS transporter [Verrucomicrobiae bacterium]|nr:MFS transporter [Verrucomicrobiae bacterium]